ncbi:TPA: hypothetical protein ACXP3C_004809 [Klebsiella pneumoniae]|uniref:hypothetical protein n=1 Tax=Klebsiella pneumoniae TaxID=573 RepID=UPI0029DB9ADF|nr:hypothetical protein [Klebsiella pneumoniae]EIW9315140.1 hypothetical protein [Klebsiella pneumoniae]EKW0029167.1 hypothetical protein [Klebsiella pneumoniae]MCE0099730.1 hypothetical protein [Klebsiella pneumoniae]MCP6150864.1 hypothetical protein [Klebsiella pneumoniae]MDX6903801.1 hypothetical protein [Klebsiella pneumoniae]
MGFKITRIDQASSTYNELEGTFRFILDGIPDETWRNLFSDKVNSYQGRNFITPPVHTKDTSYIDAKAEIHGQKNLALISSDLVIIIEDVNVLYDQEVNRIAEIQRAQSEARASLEKNVAKQIAGIKF